MTNLNKKENRENFSSKYSTWQIIGIIFGSLAGLVLLGIIFGGMSGGGSSGGTGWYGAPSRPFSAKRQK